MELDELLIAREELPPSQEEKADGGGDDAELRTPPMSRAAVMPPTSSASRSGVDRGTAPHALPSQNWVSAAGPLRNSTTSRRSLLPATEPLNQASTSAARDRLQQSLHGEPSSVVEPKQEPRVQPHVAVIHDRKLLISRDDVSTSPYALLRRWMANDPEAPSPSPSGVVACPSSGARQPAPDEVDQSAVPPLPGEAGDAEGAAGEDTNPSILRRELHERSLAVRAHFTSKRKAKLAAYHRRIGKLFDNAD